MRNRRKHTLASVTVACSLAGCVTTWETTPGPQAAPKVGVTAEMPNGWSRFNPAEGLLFTRDGVLIQSVVVTREDYGTKLENTERTLGKNIEAQEAAQTLIDSMRADQARPHLTVVDNRPAVVGGHPGFRLEVTYKTPEGLTMHETMYVALTSDSYVVVRYKAPERHYYERSSNDFERMVLSLKIEEKPAKS